MKKRIAAALALCAISALFCALADGLPEMKASLFRDSDGISAHLYFTPETPLYITTEYFRYGGNRLTVDDGNTEAQWTGSGEEIAVYLTSLGLPEADWTQFEVCLAFLKPVKGTREIAISSQTALSETDAALAEGLTPIEAEEPHTVLVGSDWLWEYEMGDMAETDGPLYVPFIGGVNSDEGSAEELVRYANMQVVGVRKLAFDFMDAETWNRPVSIPAWRVVPVELSLPEGKMSLMTVIEDEMDTAVSPEKAAEIAALALAEQYNIPSEAFLSIEGDVMLLNPPDGPENVWVVNLMDKWSGEAMDYAGQVDAATGEILWIAGPGEGNG